MLSSTSHPRLAAKARLRWDQRTGTYLLLAPERGLLLSASASRILRLCTGEHSLLAIVEHLACEQRSQSSQIEQDVLDFLEDLRRQGLIQIWME